MDITGIGYLGFESPNHAQWRTFGPEVWGAALAPSPDGDQDSVYLRLDSRRHRFAIHPGEVDKLAYIGWETPNRITYEDALAKFKAAGVETIPADAELCAIRGVKAMSRFKDPVGYQHEIFYGQRWDNYSYMPPRRHSGFDTGAEEEQGIGHVVLIAPEYTPELENFMLNVMGFRWYGEGAGGGKIGFFSSKLNKRSHTIAYAMAPGRMGIHHVGLHVQNMNDVGVAWDIVQDRQIPVQTTLGRHCQDPVVSFYAFTPSNFIFEYIWEDGHHDVVPFEVFPERLSIWGHKVVGPMLGSNVMEPEKVRGYA
jgi:2,3-dihydroxybiphenyl 1,2-dioxygenase